MPRRLAAVIFLLAAAAPVRAAYVAEQTITNTAYAASRLGHAVSAVGGNVLIGAPLTRAGLVPAGAAYLFAVDGTLLQTFPSQQAGTIGGFGVAVSPDASVAVIGAPTAQSGLAIAGRAYVFDAATGTLLQTLQSPSAIAAVEEFGYAVATQGTRVVVGAPGAQPGSGAVYVFDAATGALVQTLANPNLTVPSFGAAVATTGTQILVGAPTGGPGGGAAYLFDGPTGLLLQTFLNPSTESLEFGWAVAVVGSRVLVGAPTRATTTLHGAAYLFNSATGALVQTFVRPGSPSLDGFGSAVAGLADDDLLIGAPHAEAAYVYRGDTLALQATLAGTTPLATEFGAAVNALGTEKLVVGAPGAVGAVTIFKKLCGNGSLDAGEQCDDGNRVDGDCCSRRCEYEASGSSCSDGNACTQTDECNATGACVGTNPVICTALDECHVAGTCNTATGVCPNPIKANGSACTDDGNACTTDTCQSGACTHPAKANGTACPDDDNACTTDTCQSGTCTHPAMSDGTSCPDDGNGCTTDSCLAGSCAHPAKPNGTPCLDDGNACTTDTCQAGTCAYSCKENSPCTPGVDTICRLGTGGACTCAAAPDPPDPLSIAPPLDRSVATDPGTATAFLYTGSTPVQAGVAAGTIDPRRAALLRGRVLTRDGTGVSGVRASLVGHPELGWTRTRSDGRFDLVVNGGGSLTVRLAKTGLLPVDRQVDVPWQDYVNLPDVVMLAKDTATTAVDLSAATPIQVARGSVVSDSDGARQPTVLVRQGTQAALVYADGSTQAITALTIRTTEYTVGAPGPAAMPATLPATSAYTHAVELGADEVDSAGAVGLQFDRPVYYYLENFLTLPVGMNVPTGYYDRARALWVPAPPGRVVKIVGVTGGRADLDLDGDGVADGAAALAALDVTDTERERLALLYSIGQMLWRVPITHFSVWDHNCPFHPPNDAGGPGQPPPSGGGGGAGGGGGGTPPPGCGGGKSSGGPSQCPPPPGECVIDGSTIRCESQALGEERRVTGTPFTLHYQSDRAADHIAARQLSVPLSSATVPASLKRIELTATLGGETSVQTFPASPNQSTVVTWSGVDPYGRAAQGAAPFTIDIGYVYDGVYGRTDRFGDYPRGAISASPTRQEVTFLQRHTGTVRRWDALGVGLGGWTLDVHHSYDPQGRTLYLGTGARRMAEALGQRIVTVAGTGTTGSSGDGGAATSARLFNPWGVAAGPDGSVYIADGENDRIRKVSPTGIITAVAGCVVLPCTVPGDGGPATSAKLEQPHDVAVSPDGSLYIADTGQNRVRRVAPDGMITTVAGTGVFGYTGDGGPATAAQIVASRVAVAPDGSVYVASTATGKSVVRRVAADGVITTVAGTGPNGAGGDGGPATAAQLALPTGIALSRDGTLYIADQSNQRIRRVTPDGTITTVAGTGQSGCASTGDGGPATAARICTPQAVAVGPAGTVYIAEGGDRVRVVTPDGIIRTLAGTGTGGFSGENGPAGAAQVSQPRGLAVGPDGELYLGEVGNDRVRKIGRALTGLTSSEILIPAADASELYVFSAQGRHLRTLHGLTAAVRYNFGYDSAGRLTTITDASGNVATVQRLGSGPPAAIVAPGGQTTTLGRDANGYLSRIENPAGEAAQFTYTAGGLLRFFTTPRNHQYEFLYEADGRLKLDLDPAGGSQTLTRVVSQTAQDLTVETALGRLTTYRTELLSDGTTKRRVTRPSGHPSETVAGPDAGSETSSQADGTQATAARRPDPRFGMQAPLTSIRQVTTPGGHTLTLTESRSVTLANPLDPLSLTAATTTRSRNGRNTVETYAAAPRTITTQTPSGRQRVTTLDSLGQVVGEQFGPLAATSFGYDAQGRLQTVTRGSGAEARTYTFGYDPMHRLTSITDPTTRVTTFQPDAADRVLVQTLPDTREVRFGYDANGNVSAVTPPGRPAHTLSFTPVDLGLLYTPPTVPNAGTISTTYAYTLDRQLDLITRPDGQTIDLAYDTAGRLATVTTPAGTTTYGYDATTGHLTSIAAPGGSSLTFAYDGSLPTATTWAGPVVGSVTRTYDDDFRVSTTSVNGTQSVSFQYDPDSLLTQAGTLTLTRDAQTGLVSGTSLGQVADTRTYNAFGELATYTATVGGMEQLKIEYLQRDTLGRLTQKRETRGTQIDTDDYSYDVAGRLETVTKNASTVASYSYDANGNRLTAPNLSSPPTYDDQDRLLAYENATYTYTANGELQTKTVAGQTTTYAYDVLGNLRQVTLPNGTVVDYVIDGLNRRIGKKVNGTLVQGWLYEGWLRPAAELDGSGNIVGRFIYGIRSNVPEYLVKGGLTYRLVTDHLGSPRLVIDTATGAVAQRMDYDQFGGVLIDTNSGFQPFGFAGGLYDRDTGLVRFGARDYDPITGRWTAKDPIRFAGGDPNLYGYLLSDPVNLTDVLGLAPGDWWDPRTSIYYWAQASGGAKDFVEAYMELRDANQQFNLIGSDKFYHCLANCRASKRGAGGKDAAEAMSEGKELFDENIRGFPSDDCNSDREANAQGRDPSGPSDCVARCLSLKPAGLPPP